MDRPLILLCAPVGFGKTTVLVDWLNSRRSEGDLADSVAWLALDESDNDPVEFLRSLIMALRVSAPRVGSSFLHALVSPLPPLPRKILTLLVNELAAFGRHVILVLEDYQVIRERAVHDAVAFLLEKPTALLHMVIVTREDPPLPLPRLRARGAVCELRAADLRFTLDEVTAFAQEVMGLRLSPGDLAALATLTGGWIGALQLVALSMPARAGDVADFIAELAGRRSDLLDYLTDEVLARQSPSMVTFLLHTAVLDRLSAPLCAAVLGEENLDEVQSSLDEIERHNLLAALDGERHWYRYHPLFAALFRARLRQTEPALFTELHRRASRWHEEHGLPHDAIQHALAATDFDGAARLVGTHAMRSLAGGEIHTVLDWCLRLPVGLVQTDPRLGIAYAYALALANQPDVAEAHLQDVEQRLLRDSPSEEVKRVRAQIGLLRGIAALAVGDLERTVALAVEASDALPEHDGVGATFGQLARAYAFRANGDVTSAGERVVADVAKRVARLGFPALARIGFGLLGRLYMTQGRLRRAAKTFGQVERLTDGAQPLGVPMYFLGHGELLRQWNELATADALLQRGIDAVSELTTVDAWVAAHGYVSLARLRQAQGDSRGAMAVLDAFAVLARQREMGPQVLAHVAAARAQLWLTQGNHVAASRWAAACGLAPDGPVSYLRETEYCVLARVLFAKKNPAALMLLDRLLNEAEVHGRMGSAIEILVLRSLAWQALGDRTRAFSSLARALALGEPEGYVRVFVDEGSPMASLLRRARVHGIAPEYGDRLLGFLEDRTVDPDPAAPRPGFPPGASATSVPTLSPLVEALTRRERDVLRLVIVGASNQEIARRLTISTGTVKQHLAHIFGKFGVRSRTQAILKARTLHLD